MWHSTNVNSSVSASVFSVACGLNEHMLDRKTALFDGNNGSHAKSFFFNLHHEEEIIGTDAIRGRYM